MNYRYVQYPTPNDCDYIHHSALFYMNVESLNNITSDLRKDSWITHFTQNYLRSSRSNEICEDDHEFVYFTIPVRVFEYMIYIFYDKKHLDEAIANAPVYKLHKS